MTENQSVERVTEEKVKNPKKVAAGRAGAAARKAKQEQLLKELRAAKEQFTPPGPKEEFPKAEVPKKEVGGPKDQGRWIPWIIVGVGLAGAAALVFLRKTPKPAEKIAAPVVKQLDKSIDPFYME